MASAGKDTVVLIDGYVVSEFFTNVDSNPTVAALNCTGFGVASKQYLPGLKDGTMSLQGFYAVAHGEVDEILRAVFAEAAGQVVSIGIAGLAVGAAADVLTPKLSAYRKTSVLEDVNKATVDLQANGGIDYALSLHDVTEEDQTEAGTTHDQGAATTNGGVAHLHVTGVVGDTAQLDVVIEHSADGSTWETLVTFIPATAVGAERVVIAAGTTVQRYTRALWTITGVADPAFTFAVLLARRS